AIARSPTAAPVPPPSLTLDAYKAHVARHILERNADRSFSGRLPPMLPAIVVVNITVDGDGRLTDVQVQRSRDPHASRVALASMLRSG
ncbi:TonB C-terminal domain-containing protein, partial [Escherichia coli]|nr:TonB C-terminal domain-containing protein [Escherichia coli]